MDSSWGQTSELQKKCVQSELVEVWVEKATVTRGHVYAKFGTGCRITLDTIPKEKGISVRDALLKFHKEWYSSNIMGLTVLGKEDLDTLQHIVIDRFARVENKHLDLPEWTQPPFSESECGTITQIVPVKDIRRLVVTWGIPDMRDQFKAGPGSYLSHLIGHEGPGSLLSHLRASGWAIGLTAGTRVGGKGFSFFYVSIDLTKEGMDHVDDAIFVVFQYLLNVADGRPPGKSLRGDERSSQDEVPLQGQGEPAGVREDACQGPPQLPCSRCLVRRMAAVRLAA